ncbi:MAG: acetate--CoA ligase family protein [Candidatus Nanohaloarchaeota archaeon QJJ-9]|nr:acetate--CoA ligase family protein [Candidatus Nanohaloarchaeota archaeon QJJ-9]
MKLREKFGKANVTEHQAKHLLQKEGLDVVENRLAETEEEAEKAAEKIGTPVVLKVDSKDIHHKTDIGGLKIVNREEKIGEAFREIRENVKEEKEDVDIRGIIVEEKIEGQEFIAGINTDPQFGKVLMFGLGGIYVEVFKDVSFRVIPAEEKDIVSMVDELESRPLLEGVRGQEKADMEKLVETLRKLSKIGEKYGDLNSLDINPIFIKGDQIKIGDALITLEEEE